MGRGLPKADIATRSYLLAAIFSLIKENRAMTNAHRNTQQFLADLQIRLEVTFSLSPEQKVGFKYLVYMSSARLSGDRQMFVSLQETSFLIVAASHLCQCILMSR